MLVKFWVFIEFKPVTYLCITDIPCNGKLFRTQVMVSIDVLVKLFNLAIA